MARSSTPRSSSGRPSRSRAWRPRRFGWGSSRVELLRPLGPETPVGRFLTKRGPGLHHVAFEVADLAAELDRLRADGVQLIDESPRKASTDCRSRSSIPRRRAAFWQSSSVMTPTDRIRIEIALDGQQVLSVLVPAQTADDLDRALAGEPRLRLLLRSRRRPLYRPAPARRLRQALCPRKPRRLRGRRVKGYVHLSPGHQNAQR